MNLHLYPHQWGEIAQSIKAACDYRCMACQRQCRRPGEFWLGWEYELHVAHWDHDYDSAEIYVVACCVRCHFLHDAPFVWVARRRAERWRQRQAGQLSFFPARG